MCQADQDQKQSKLAKPTLSKGSGDAESLGDTRKRIQQTEDWSNRGIGVGQMIEITTQGTTKRLDPSRIPVGNIGNSTGFNLVMIAVGFTNQDSRWRIAVRDCIIYMRI